MIHIDYYYDSETGCMDCSVRTVTAREVTVKEVVFHEEPEDTLKIEDYIEINNYYK